MNVNPFNFNLKRLHADAVVPIVFRLTERWAHDRMLNAWPVELFSNQIERESLNHQTLEQEKKLQRSTHFHRRKHQMNRCLS